MRWSSDKVAKVRQLKISLRLLTLSLGLGLVVTSGCKFFAGGKSNDTSQAPAQPASCVADMQAVDATKFDLEGDLAIKVKATLKGTVHLKELTTKLDRDVSDACMNLARDLDSAKVEVSDSLAPGEHAKAACEEAAKRVKQAREKGGVVLLTYPQAPVCSVSLDDYTRCAKDCDMTLASFSSGVMCDPASTLGRCDAKCDGVCLLSGSDECKGQCRGTCKGSCDAEFYGKCGGTCKGTCDGKTAAGKCKGTCEGKCSGDADGVCQGKCSGGCGGTCLNPATKNKCGGVCSGKCSEAFSAQRCGAVSAPAEMVPECGAMCDAQFARDLNCQAGYVSVSVYNSAKEGAGASLKTALDRQLSTLLTSSDGMKEPVDKAHEGIATGYTAIEEMLAEDEAAKKQVQSCLQTASKQREEAAAALTLIREAAALALASVKD
jgi:hypothetical protein